MHALQSVLGVAEKCNTSHNICFQYCSDVDRRNCMQLLCMTVCYTLLSERNAPAMYIADCAVPHAIACERIASAT